MKTLFCNPTTLLHHPLTPSHVRLTSIHVRPRGIKVPALVFSSKKTGIVCKSGVREIKETEFGEVVLKSESPVLVEFVANWCGPCRLISPAVESLAQEYKEKLTIVKIDHDSNPSLIEEFKVYGLPTLILFKNGKEVPESRREGAITKVKLKAYVDSLLDSVSVS